MTDFANPTYIFPAVTNLNRMMPGIIEDHPNIDSVFESMGGYEYLGLVKEPTNTDEVLQNIK